MHGIGCPGQTDQLLSDLTASVMMYPSPYIDVVLSVNIWYTISQTLAANWQHDRCQGEGKE